MSPPKPTYRLLSEGQLIPATIGPNLLGALCDSVSDPAASWKPDNAAAVFRSKFVTSDRAHQPQCVSMRSTQHVLKGTKSSGAHAALEGLLQAAWARATSDSYNMEAQWIKTVRLQQHPDMFRALLDDESVKTFRKERDRKCYYFITGYKTCINGVVQRKKSDGRDLEIDLEVPLNLITSALGAPLPPGVLPDPNVGGKWTTALDNLSSYTLQGEYIFAVEAKEVLPRNLIRDLLKRRSTERDQRVQLARKAMGFKLNEAVYGTGGHAHSYPLVPSPQEYIKACTRIDNDDPYVLGLEVDDNFEESGYCIDE